MNKLKKNNGRLGTHHTEEAREKIRQSQLGKIVSEETRLKQSIAAKARFARGDNDFGGNPFGIGSKHKLESLEKISKFQRGKKVPFKPRPYMQGELCHFWRGGVAKTNDVIKHSREYKEWRKAVFERDNYTCQWCFVRGEKLNADHIKPFADFPKLRFMLSNGRTLCVPCHKKTDTWGSRTLWRKYEKV